MNRSLGDIASFPTYRPSAVAITLIRVNTGPDEEHGEHEEMEREEEDEGRLSRGDGHQPRQQRHQTHHRRRALVRSYQLGKVRLS
jgi:hypothetical protein